MAAPSHSKTSKLSRPAGDLSLQPLSLRQTRPARAGAPLQGVPGQRASRVVGISANDVTTHPDDSPAMMAREKAAVGYTFPYLYDESQAVAKAYQAACTPDFFVFDKSQKLVYRGQMDGSRPGNMVAVTGKDLRAPWMPCSPARRPAATSARAWAAISSGSPATSRAIADRSRCRAAWRSPRVELAFYLLMPLHRSPGDRVIGTQQHLGFARCLTIVPLGLHQIALVVIHVCLIR